MPVHIEIPDDFFTLSQKNKLMSLFSVETDEDFSNALNRIALAALDEYREMFLGMGMPSRADEIREFRLYHLIKRYFQGIIPNELEVSSMFQLPETRSKSLILYVLTRFRYDLENEILHSVGKVIEEAEELDDGVQYRLFIPSMNIADEINRIILSNGFRLKRLSSIRGEPNFYIITRDSIAVVRHHLENV